MVSLLSLAHITDEGVHFRSPHDGSQLLLTPEKSIELQNIIGSDIMMQLDDVISSVTTGPRVEEAMHRSIDWLDRCIKVHLLSSAPQSFSLIVCLGTCKPRPTEPICNHTGRLGLGIEETMY